MNKTLLAVVVAAALAVPIVPVLAQGASPPPAPAAEPQPGGTAAMPPVGDRAMPRHEMWMHRRLAGSPQERCIDRLAWRAARRAYVETKLDLTAEQRPLWDKVESLAQQEEQKEHQLCSSLPTTATAPTLVERMDRLQQFLAARLDGLRAAEPAVQALYQALTPTQRAILDHPFRRS